VMQFIFELSFTIFVHLKFAADYSKSQQTLSKALPTFSI